MKEPAFDYKLADAYALGYYHGRAYGTEKNDFVDDASRHYYAEGYERGVADYCRFDNVGGGG